MSNKYFLSHSGLDFHPTLNILQVIKLTRSTAKEARDGDVSIN